MFELIDSDADGFIDKQETEYFLKIVLIMQPNLTFNSGSSFNSNVDDRQN